MKETTDTVEQNNETKPADNQNVETNSAVEGNDNPNNVPYTRFNDVTKKNKELLSKIAKMEEEQEASRVKKLEEQGEFKTLNAELQDKLKQASTKLDYYEQLEQQEREALLQGLSDDDKAIYGELDTVKLRKHVENSSSTNKVRTDASAPIRGNKLNIKSDDEIWNKMDSKERQSNWSNIVRHFKKK